MQYIPTLPFDPIYVTILAVDVMEPFIVPALKLLVVVAAICHIVYKLMQSWAARRYVRHCSQRAARPDVILSTDIALRCKVRRPIIVESMFEAHLPGSSSGMVAIYIYCAYNSRRTLAEYSNYATAQLFRRLTGVGDDLPHFMGMYCVKTVADLSNHSLLASYSIEL